VFFLQAEDGIRDWSVTGVQTCALPILSTHQDADGAWDAGDLQITSFVMMGLAAVGGTAADAAIVAAANYYLTHQFVPGGWPAEGSSTGPASGFAEGDGEVVRPMAALFRKSTRSNVPVGRSPLSTAAF